MFTKIIANPPFGNDASTAKAVAKLLLKLFPEITLLAPKNCFKPNEIEKHVQAFKCTENVFESVSITGLTIARLSKVEGNFKYSMLEEMYLKGVRKYIYRYNNIQKEKGLPYKLQAGNTQLSVWKKKGSTVENTFMLGVWGCNKQGWARKWNVDNNENAIYEPTSKKGGAPMTKYGALSACGIIFQSKEERDNLVNWFYHTKIYKEESVTCSFIPYVDWSKSWTDAEILKEIGLSEDFLEVE